MEKLTTLVIETIAEYIVNENPYTAYRGLFGENHDGMISKTDVAVFVSKFISKSNEEFGHLLLAEIMKEYGYALEQEKDYYDELKESKRIKVQRLRDEIGELESRVEDLESQILDYESKLDTREFVKVRRII